MYHFFVSYSRRDADWVRLLVDRLRAGRADVWLDQEDIPASVPWLREIKDAVAEAHLVVCCDSPDFRGSTNCAVEVSLAEEAGKPRFFVPVGSDLDQAVRSIQESAAQIEPRRRRRTELTIAARDWDRAGRRPAGLVRNRRRRRLTEGLGLPPALSATERSFLRAGRRRSIRRVGVAIAAVVLPGVLIGVARAFPAVEQQVAEASLSQARAYAEERTGLEVVARDPYAGLALAAGLGGDEAQVHAAVVSRALRAHVPDDAFTVPGGAERFVVAPIADQVIVADPAGRRWTRPAGESDGRAARPLSPGAAGQVEQPAGHTVVARGGGTVEVRVDGRLHRAVTFGGRPGRTALSPDARLLAAVVGARVEIADLSTGDIRAVLRGPDDPLTDVAWGRTGDRVWAAGPARVVSWSLSTATTLRNDPAEAFSAVLPSATPGRVWVAGRRALIEIDVADGRVRDRRAVDDEITSAGGSPDGTTALLSGRDHAWVQPLTGTAPARSFDIPDCRYGRATFRDAETAYLPCIGGPLAQISTGRAAVVSARPVIAGLFGARAQPGSDLLLAGNQNGELFSLEPGGPRLLLTSTCRASFSRIAVSADARSVLPVGDGSGMSICTQVGRRAGGTGDWTFHTMIESTGQSIHATSAVFSPAGGSFAIGYGDGTVTLHPQNFSPALTVDTVVGAVRDMLARPDGTVVLVTSAGVVRRFPLCDDCLSNAALSRQAAARLSRAAELGLTVPAPRPAPSR